MRASAERADPRHVFASASLRASPSCDELARIIESDGGAADRALPGNRRANCSARYPDTISNACSRANARVFEIGHVLAGAGLIVHACTRDAFVRARASRNVENPDPAARALLSCCGDSYPPATWERHA